MSVVPVSLACVKDDVTADALASSGHRTDRKYNNINAMNCRLRRGTSKDAPLDIAFIMVDFDVTTTVLIRGGCCSSNQLQ